MQAQSRMTKTVHLRFKLADDSEVSVDADAQQTLMEVARDNGIRGIEAQCGGAMACGTCCVELTDPCIPPADADELEVLDLLPNSGPATRLSCQILVSALTDGVVVVVPSD